MQIAIGSDHRGYNMKVKLAELLDETGLSEIEEGLAALSSQGSSNRSAIFKYTLIGKQNLFRILLSHGSQLNMIQFVKNIFNLIIIICFIYIND